MPLIEVTIGQPPESRKRELAVMAVTTWGMLEGGELTGKYNRESDEPKRYEAANVEECNP